MKKLSFCMEEIYERTKSYRDHSGRKRTLGKGTRNAENLWTCKGMRQILKNICMISKTLGEISYGLRFFHRKLETIQRRSGSTDETVPRLS